MLCLRPASAGDVPALADLWHAGWMAGHAGKVPDGLVQFRGRDDFRARLLASLTEWYVAGKAGAPEGLVRLKGCELDQFYVAPSQIGRGVALPLMRAAEDLMRSQGVVDAYLVCALGNRRAAQFYRKAGWREAGVMRGKVETRDGPFEMDLIRFEKTL